MCLQHSIHTRTKGGSHYVKELLLFLIKEETNKRQDKHLNNPPSQPWRAPVATKTLLEVTKGSPSSSASYSLSKRSRFDFGSPISYFDGIVIQGAAEGNVIIVLIDFVA